ncbi:MAG: hypothetical protein A3K11_00330 [Nitrospirae bacterium RIFCSPLOWO2_12_FULL_63_8]|nr:MAG: hypothetical protein A3K11_00330 [Nitrospirae bacterium RIFCSPLOWO2_12_FULL_63_8]
MNHPLKPDESRSADPHPAHGERERLVRAEQVKLLYSNAPLALTVTVLNAVIVTILQWNVIVHSVLIAWLTYMVTLSSIRFLLVRRYWRSSSAHLNGDHWETWHIAGVALAGLGWGLAGIFLFPEESPNHQVFLAFVLGGMMAGAATVLAPMRAAFLAFIIPIALPITLRFLAEGDDVHLAMGTLVGLFSCATLAIAWRSHNALITSLRLRFENRDLLAYLAHAKRETETLNDELTYEIAERKRAQKERERLITDLQDALANLKVLRGLLPICSHCKKIRDDAGGWQAVEVFVKEHSEADFSHGICPECLNRLYPELGKNNLPG